MVEEDLIQPKKYKTSRTLRALIRLGSMKMKDFIAYFLGLIVFALGIVLFRPMEGQDTSLLGIVSMLLGVTVIAAILITNYVERKRTIQL